MGRRVGVESKGHNQPLYLCTYTFVSGWGPLPLPSRSQNKESQSSENHRVKAVTCGVSSADEAGEEL